LWEYLEENFDKIYNHVKIFGEANVKELIKIGEKRIEED